MSCSVENAQHSLHTIVGGLTSRCSGSSSSHWVSVCTYHCVDKK